MLTQQHCICVFIIFINREEFCEIFRAKDKNTLKMYTCKKFLKKDGRKVRKAAKNEILILKMYVFHAGYLYDPHFSKERCLQMVLSVEICLTIVAECSWLFTMQMILFFADSHDFFSLSTLLPFTVSQFLSCFLSVSPRRVKHLNILQLVDVFETRKEYFLFLELYVLWDFHMWEWIRKYKSANGYVLHLLCLDFKNEPKW